MSLSFVPTFSLMPNKNLYAGKEATVRTGHETTDWFQTGKGVYQGCIIIHADFFCCLFIYFYWRLIILQYCSGFCPHWHESTMGVHVSPILNPLPTPSLSHPLGCPSAQALSGLLHASKMDWSGTSGKQPACLHRWLFNFYAEYILWNGGLNETQAGIKIARRNINNLR